ncbi:MAG: hypothetical protein HYS12_12355 [Planctomycetes bacterium]|nr:hypothetical protein [Planctomycetota bacterium]
MKAEQRKELQANSLVRFLGRLKQNFKGGPALSRKATVIWGIVILALLVFVGWRIASSRSEANNSARWVTLDSLSGTDELDQFIDKNQGTIQANVARLQKARKDLESGLGGLYTQHSTAVDKLQAAANAYEDLAKQFKATPVLVQECLLGTGKAYEGMGDFEKARGFYNDLQTRFKDSPLAKEAERRAKDLEKHAKDLATLDEKLKKGGDPLAFIKEPKEK